MNYFAHGRHYTDDPYFLAGTAVPDWLSAVDRKVRVRPPQARQYVDATEGWLASLARGIVQHHYDDGWFHGTRAFTELEWQLTALVKQQLPGDEGFRPSFLGHILVEMLLDAVLITEEPSRLDEYYIALERVEPDLVQTAVNRMSTGETQMLSTLVDGFCQTRFLEDYQDDERLLFRLNQVMRRVRLPALPEGILAVLPEARRAVEARQEELLTAPEG